MSGELVPIPFYDDQMLAVRGTAGRVLVGIRRICESLEINFSGQLQKLKRCHWSGVCVIHAPDARGSVQEHSVIPHDRLAMWLATIHPSKVAEPVREKLMRYQVEAADVLARHFLGNAVSEPAPASTTTSTDDLLGMAEALVGSIRKQRDLERSVAVVQDSQVALERKNRELEARLTEVTSALDRAEANAARAVRTVTGESGFFTLVPWAERHGVYLAPPSDGTEGKVVTAMCRAEEITPGKVHGPKYPVNTYPEHVLLAWLDGYRRRRPRTSGLAVIS